MGLVVRCLVGLSLLLLVILATALYLVGSSPPRITKPHDVFGFADLGRGAVRADLPDLHTYTARDGAVLSYRFYDSAADRLLIFIHGSSYHGAGYHDLASRMSRGDVAKVVTPNLRGHHMSGRRRGDVDYIGQLEDDLRDLIEFLRGSGQRGRIILGGHSSGGGLAIRFAGGANSHSVSSYLLLSPVIPTSPSVNGGTAGGWASFHQRRFFGLLALNALGIHWFDGLPVIEFNKPEKYWDGTETLSYSYRLNTSYHPRYDYQRDIQAVQSKALLMLVGEQDQAIDSDALRALFASDSANTEIEVLPNIDHFGVFRDHLALNRVAMWLPTQ